MQINFEQHEIRKTLFGKKEKTTQKQESAEEFLAFQREQLDPAVDGDRGITRNYNDQNSINEALFEYADVDKNGTIDEKEYKRFIMESVSDGTVSTETYALLNGINESGMVTMNDSAIMTADYEDLVRVSDVYSSLLDADEGIDKNGDGVLTKEEFLNSASLRIMTDPNVKQSLYSKNSMSQSEKIKIMSQLSSGVVGNYYNLTDFRYTMNYLSGQYEMCYVQKPVIEPDYNTLIDVADRYRQQTNN